MIARAKRRTALATALMLCGTSPAVATGDKPSTDPQADLAPCVAAAAANEPTSISPFAARWSTIPRRRSRIGSRR